VDPVLGPDRRGVIILSDAPLPEVTEALRGSGHNVVTSAEAGLRVDRADHQNAARTMAVGVRRPSMVLDQGVVVVAPDGRIASGDDPVRLVAEAMAFPIPPQVAVFGGAWITEDEPEYEEIRRLGRWLAGRGAHLVCGGYQGAMAAACQGVAEVGGTAVGITIAEWEDVVTVNEWLTHELVARDLFARLPVITDADAWVAFPGGVGTLQEVALCWNLVQTELARPRPLLLVGQGWDRQLRLFRELLRVSNPAHFDLVRPVASFDDVVEALSPAVEAR
jgi:uncharacterized protein (TIGR00730 family)